MSIGTAFPPRTAPLNRKMQWREWAGYLAASAYADHLDIEYNAIREAAALIDVTPLYKYLVSGPDAVRLIDRIITRDASKLQVGQIYYTCWCDEEGKVIDDGTVGRLDEGTYRWTAADPSLRWFTMNASGLDVGIEEITEAVAALAVQGPLSRAVVEAATGEGWGDLKYFRRRASRVGDIEVDVSRTGYTGDLGYELWVDADRAVTLWDAVREAGAAFGAGPAGMLALDVARVEAGLILPEGAYTSSRAAPGVRRTAPGGEGHQHRLEPDPQGGDRPGLGGEGGRRSRHRASHRMDGRGPARNGARRRGRPPLVRPTPQAHLRSEPGQG